MHNLDLILTLTGGLAAALALGYLTHRIGLSPIVGYLLAGIAVGPHTPGFVADPNLADQMAEIGVILLLFGVGLQFHLDELLSVRRVAVPGALIASLAATTLGTLLGRAFGWDWSAGLVFGQSLSVASTVVLTRVLADHRALHTRAGHVAVGWLVVEDLYTVLVLVLLPTVLGPRAGGAGELALAVGLAVVKIAALIAFTFLVGGRAIPWLLDRVARTGSRELFTLTVLVLVLGIAVGSAELFGASMALGAFLAGLVVGRSDYCLRALSDALSMRDAFAVLFFVSIGMLLDPRHLVAAPGQVIATLAFVLAWKPIAAMTLLLVFRQPPRVALRVGLALGQIGEFSFILAALGKQLGVLPDAATHSLVAAAIGSITLSPLLYRLGGPIERWLARRPRLWARLTARSAGDLVEPGPVPQADPDHRAVVVGHGPVGRTVCRLLRENDIEPTVIEMNVDTVRALREQGVPAVYGDAIHPDTLKEAGVATAGTLILSSAGMHGSTEVIRLARVMNPGVRVFGRTAYVREMAALRSCGAEVVFSGEGEVALALTVALLRELGATPEQIDRERDRVRGELLGRAEGDVKK
jgi:CPA2 family monovalent cation:H+ antiporter-2